MESEDSLASTGLVFIPEGRVLYTSSVQIIPIQIERSRLTGPLLELQSWLQDVDKRLDNIQLSSTVQDDRNRVGAMTSDLRSPIIGGLKTMVRQMSDEIDHQTSVIRDFFLTMGETSRQRRSIIGGISALTNVANFALGVVTSSRIDRLHSMLVSTEETARKALSMGEVSFSLLESTLGDVT